MKTPFLPRRRLPGLQRLMPALLCGLLAVLFSHNSSAALYTFNYPDAGPIPQGGSTFSIEHTISGIESSITGLQLILTFNDSSSLNGSIQGLLNLGTDPGSPFVSFTPAISYAGTGSQVIYDVNFSGLNGSNPNGTWGLVLWDTSNTGIENGLVGWSLGITAVPEPVSMAGGIFGGLVLAAGLWRSLRAPERTTRKLLSFYLAKATQVKRLFKP
jgi:hypothetical protein